MERLRSWFFFVALLALLAFGIFAAKDQSSVLHWPTTMGRVESVDFVQVVTGVSKGGGVMVAYVPVVNYRYWVRGVSYKGKRISPNEGEEIPKFKTQSPDEFNRFLGKPLFGGSEVTVHYNPKDSGNSYLFAWPSGFPLFFAILPAVPLVIALMMGLRPESKRPIGFWASFLLSTRRRSVLWKGLWTGLLAYPLLPLSFYGFGTGGPAVITLSAHYATTLILPSFARLAGEILKPTQTDSQQSHPA